MLILFCYFVDEIWECGRCRQFWTGRDADGEMAVWCRSCWCKKSSNQLRVRLGIDCTCRVKQQWNDTKNVIRKIKAMSAIPVKKHLMKNQQLKNWKTEQKKTTAATKCQLLIFFIFSNQISFYRRWKLICEKNFFIFFWALVQNKCLIVFSKLCCVSKRFLFIFISGCALVIRFIFLKRKISSFV